MTRQWQCCRAVGGRQMTQREEEGGWRGWCKACWRRTTRREGGGGRREASGRWTTGQHNKRVGVGAHYVVGGDDSGCDSGNGSWSSEIRGVPSSMPGTAAPVMEPDPGGVDDADIRQRADGSRRRQGGGEEGSDDGDGGAAADRAGRRVTTGRPLPRRRPSPQ